MSIDLGAGRTDTPGTVERDHYGRPRILPLGGGKPKAYTRCTTYIKALEDTYHLERWKLRHVALGLVDRPDLRLSVAANRADKAALDGVCRDAMDAAGASAAATTGTALHRLAELSDRGELYSDDIPAEHRPDIEAYRRATTGLHHHLIESLMVCDDLGVAGTPDRITGHRGDRFVFDIKTGRLDFGLGTIAMQLAVYAHSAVYSPTTGDRYPIPGLRTDKAIVCHLPAGAGTCDLYWVDIAAGWEGVQLATEVRAWRRRKHRLDVLESHPVPAAPSWADRIAAAETTDALTQVWQDADAAGEWTPHLTALAVTRKTAITGGTT